MARPLAMKGQGRQAVAAGCHEAVGWPVAGGRARRRNCRRHVDFYILFSLKGYEDVCRQWVIISNSTSSENWWSNSRGAPKKTAVELILIRVEWSWLRC
jgi:hypothetical protein